ncbi:hypothetical protein HAX54_014886 [Datura stramonium]|uniref:Uncharacterized protein n=1 Tax=Datura stramonium TaxID=4076 RepID=A0ABS8TQS0_DATST|nr:hypothetical protein [Datura stramonium]
MRSGLKVMKFGLNMAYKCKNGNTGLKRRSDRSWHHVSIENHVELITLLLEEMTDAQGAEVARLEEEARLAEAARRAELAITLAYRNRKNTPHHHRQNSISNVLFEGV